MSRISNRNILIVVFLLFLMLLAGTAQAEEMTMSPGDTLDISGITGHNTAVYIKESGEYTLLGSSNLVNIVVQPEKGSNIMVWLCDGLSIKPGKNGNSAAAICVEDGGGTVRLRTKKKATVVLEGKRSPGVEKKGTKTKLVFDSEDGTNDCSLTARGHDDTLKLLPSSGIGGSSDPTWSSTRKTIGNIYFESGTIYAYGGTERTIGAAGIGTGSQNCKNLWFTGATVYAYAGGDGVAIGCGSCACGDVSMDGIHITGGAVYADSSNSDEPAIGAATHSHLFNVTVTGGTVKTYSNYIGIGADEGAAGGIEITGGAVAIRLANAKCGIGSLVSSPEAQHDTTVYTSVNISGGEVVILCTKVNNCVGFVAVGASADQKGVADPTPFHNSEVTVSGGTVRVLFPKKAKPAFKAPKKGVTIMGGSVQVAYGSEGIYTTLNEKDGIMQKSVSGKNGTSVHLMQVRLKNAGDHTRVTRIMCAKNTGENWYAISDYGMNDIYTIGEMLYLWVPDDATDYLVAAYAEDGTEYSTWAEYPLSGTSAELVQPTIVTLNAGGGEGFVDGSAKGYLGEIELHYYVGAKAPSENYYLLFYTFEGGAIADETGKLKNRNSSATERGVWMKEGGAVVFDASWEAPNTRYVLDPNKPREASNPVVDGYPYTGVHYVDVPPGGKALVEPVLYSLKGWQFEKWSVNKDGTGTSYVVGDEFPYVEPDPGTYGKVIGLYAQWTPRSYTINFKNGEQTNSAVCEYDKLVQLPKPGDCGFTPPPGRSQFLGWEYTDEAGRTQLLNAGDLASNRCTVNADGTLTGYTFTARWQTEPGVASLSVILNDVPVTDIAKESVRLGTVSAFAIENGAYLFNVDPGTYSATVPGFDTDGITLEKVADTPALLVLSYADITAKAEKEDLCSVWLGEDRAIGSLRMLKGENVKLSAAAKTGAVFSHWKYEGDVPGFDAEATVQNITVNEKVDFTAVCRYAVYKIRFDANGGTGAMDDLEMTYGAAALLSQNRFTKVKYAFSGWNTKPDGTGASYKDRESVENLSETDGAVVTLYAQWQPCSWYVRFRSGTEEPDIVQTFFFGISAPLDGCTFRYEGRSFLGWNTQPDGTGMSFTDRQTVTDLVSEPSQELILWAMWSVPDYTVLSGADGVYTIPEGDPLRFVGSGPYPLFVCVFIDGAEVRKSSISVYDGTEAGMQEGSTAVELPRVLLNTYSPGRHTIRLCYADGETEEVAFAVNSAYRFVSGQGSVWLTSQSDGLAFETNGLMDSFSKVEIDGALLDSGSYDVPASGTAKIDLHPDYLRLLSETPHTIQVFFTNGATEMAGFTVAAAYAFTSGDGTVWPVSSGQPIWFTTNGSITQYVRVEVDGTGVDDEEIDVFSGGMGGGGLSVELPPEFLTVLNVGNHTIRVVFTNGSTPDAAFTVSNDYAVIYGGGSVYTVPASTALVFIANGPYPQFAGVVIDEMFVSETEFSVSASIDPPGTLVSLPPDFMNILDAGEHTIEVVYTNGRTAPAGFTVVNAYTFLSGPGSVYTKPGTEPLRFIVNGNLPLFVRLEIDGTAVADADMKLTAGSTIIDLDALFLNTLASGEHTVQAFFANGQTLPAGFSVRQGLVILEHPRDVSVTAGKKASFSVSAISDSTITYCWEVDRHDGRGFEPVGRDSSQYTTSPVMPENSGYTYRCVVSDTTGVKLISETATLTVTAIPKTGDKNQPLLLALLTGVSFAGFALLWGKRFRIHRR